jgi:hypothetical protein
MILYSSTSRYGKVNLISDFILNKIPKEETSIIQVADCENFFVIKGKTTYKEVLELSNVSSELVEKYPQIFTKKEQISRIIDLIEYDVKLTPVESIVHSYYNSENCIYNQLQINSFKKNKEDCFNEESNLNKLPENQIVCSSFPHGYSLNYGRNLFYYGKYIAYNIRTYPNINKVTLNLSFKNNVVGEFENMTNVFVSDIDWLVSEIKKVDWCIETTDPLNDYEFLKKN